MATKSIWNHEIHLWFLPKARFKWREPKEFLRLRDAQERARLRWWHQPLAVLVTATMLLVSWYLARLNPHKHPPPLHTAVFMDLVFSILFVYGMPWIISLCPSEVSLSEKYIAYRRGNSNQGAKYVDIEYFAWRMTEGITTLVLKKRKAKREMLIGVPPEIARNDVHLFLLSRDVMPQPGA